MEIEEMFEIVWEDKIEREKYVCVYVCSIELINHFI